MRKTLFAMAALASFAAFTAEASAQEHAPVDVEAAEASDGCARRVLGRGAGCRTEWSFVQQCEISVHVRAAALRRASSLGRRSRAGRCV